MVLSTAYNFTKSYYTFSVPKLYVEINYEIHSNYPINVSHQNQMKL